MYKGQIYGGDFSKFFGLLKIYELYSAKKERYFKVKSFFKVQTKEKVTFL